MKKCSSTKPATHSRDSYKKQGCTGLLPTTAWVLSLTMPQGKSVAVPKASWFTKLPQRPMAWPMRKPREVTSSTAATFSLRSLAMSPPNTRAPMMPP